jgi:hypothetical protein
MEGLLISAAGSSREWRAGLECTPAGSELQVARTEATCNSHYYETADSSTPTGPFLR